MVALPGRRLLHTREFYRWGFGIRVSVRAPGALPAVRANAGHRCEGGYLFLPTCVAVDAANGTFHVGNHLAWFLTHCPGDLLLCDIQQIIPLQWVQGKLDPLFACPEKMAQFETVKRPSLPKKVAGDELFRWTRDALTEMLSEPVLLDKMRANDILQHTGEAAKGSSLEVSLPDGFDADKPTLFLITATCARDGWQSDRKAFIGRHISALHEHMVNNELLCQRTNGAVCRQFLWIIAEDGAYVDDSIADLLRCSKTPFVYFAFGPTRRYGNAQKNALLELIHKFTRALQFNGVVLPVDDDSYVQFDLLYDTKRFAFLPVWLLGPEGVEYAVADENGRAKEVHAAWETRKFPLDFNGLAWSTSIFEEKVPNNRLYWPSDVYGGETEFIEAHAKNLTEVEVPCNKCAMVWHNKKLEPTDRIFQCPAVPTSSPKS
ncbi:MAG: hypothetical protein BJ554DRAFT_3420 [Olpidium bornovanus]|uniref:Uncharacterized protein n=1 Tax=Olpidium bornovanus TaxID=278681 RepID=A0A8H8DFU5_9FUNG|nr:MAG: hypothetical protein BJ554DRAFT_3420 [Olpidium bornovanus]